LGAGNEDDDRLDGWPNTPVEPPRPGPDLIESDTWGEPTVAASASAYSGHYHVRSTSRRRLAIGVAVVALIAAVAIPLSLRGSSAPPPSSTAVLPGVSTGSNAPAGSDVSPLTSSQGSAGTSTSPSGPPTTTAAPTRTVVATTRPPTKPTVNPPLFTPITVEAEAGGLAVTLGGSARIAPYDGASGGKVARNIGDWNMQGGPGTLGFNDVTFPSDGTYVLAISFVHLDNEPTRTAQITVSGLTPVTATFTSGSQCCAVKEVSVVVPAGTRTITISNQQGRVPAIDKVVISGG
jgi:hypothetical protein